MVNITVPERMIGCWKRRYIQFNDGQKDISTNVFWLQTLSGMVDMRIPVRKHDFSNRRSLQEYKIEELIELAEQDYGTGITRLDESTKPYATASWEYDEYDVNTQPVETYPEAGWMDWRDDNHCMMEWAPSGAYEEEWRLQPNSNTYVANFRNINAEKKEIVFIAGNHAVYVRDRDIQITEQRLLQDIAVDNKNNSIGVKYHIEML